MSTIRSLCSWDNADPTTQNALAGLWETDDRLIALAAQLAVVRTWFNGVAKDLHIIHCVEEAVCTLFLEAEAAHLTVLDFNADLGAGDTDWDVGTMLDDVVVAIQHGLEHGRAGTDFAADEAELNVVVPDSSAEEAVAVVEAMSGLLFAGERDVLSQGDVWCRRGTDW